jgi:hypothetical protein
MIEAIAKNGLPIIPQNILIGGEKGGGLIEQFMGISMIEKLTGKPFNGSDSNHKAPEESFIVEDKHDEATEENPNSPAEENGEGDGTTKVDSPADNSSPSDVPTAPKGGENHRNKK